MPNFDLVFFMFSLTLVLSHYIQSSSSFTISASPSRVRSQLLQKSVMMDPSLLWHRLTSKSKDQDSFVELDQNDTIWAFHSRTTCNLPITVHKSSEYGNVYLVDLMKNSKFKQVKPRNQCKDGESSVRYACNLGSLKMRTAMIDENSYNSNMKKILCLHRHKCWWMKPVFLDYNHNNEKDIHNDEVPPETIFILGLDNKRSEANYNDFIVDVNTKDKEQRPQQELYRFVLPLIVPDQDGCTSCSLRSARNEKNEIELHSETGGKVALYCGIGPDPFALIDDGIKMASVIASNQNDAINWEQQQLLPTFAYKLGWCTWNAFYTQLTGEKIVSAVKILQEKDIPVKWMIIDDGWQHTTNDFAKDGMQWGERLLSLNASTTKFAPELNHSSPIHTALADEFVSKTNLLSLKETVSKLKQPKYDVDENSGMGLEAVLAWHALPGYWLGLASHTEHSHYMGPGTNIFYPHFSTNIMECDSSLINEQSIVKGIGIANNATLFYDEYHSFLQMCGFDGVKVDAQGVTGFLRPYPSRFDLEHLYVGEHLAHRHQVSHQLQDALALSIKRRFSEDKMTRNYDEKTDTLDKSRSSNLIMCMCHSIDIIYRLSHLYTDTKPLMRASDDFYPDNDHCHGPHLVACAFNSLLIGKICIPDWDMFTSGSTITGEMHAMARAISGGPIYFSDKPHLADPRIIQKLACRNGMILCCASHALPTRASLLNDPLCKDSPPMVIWNVNGQLNKNEDEITSGVLGIFNLGASGKWCYDSLDFIQSQDKKRVTPSKIASISVMDVEPFRNKRYKNTRFVAVSTRDGMLGILNHYETIQIEVHFLQSDIVHLLPIIEVNDYIQFVPLGISKLYNFGGAVKRVVSGLVDVKDSDFGYEKRKAVSISIETSGCGVFLIAYKILKSFELLKCKGAGVVQVKFDGEPIESCTVDTISASCTMSTKMHKWDEKIALSFIEDGYNILCTDIPVHHELIEGILDVHLII